MKDRIRQVMESQHMTQQVFADYIGLAPATLSSIFNGRTRPTLNVVEALKKKIPDINTDWLMFGSGEMYQNTTENSTPTPSASEYGIFDQSPMLDFEQNTPAVPQNMGQTTQNSAIINKSRPDGILFFPLKNSFVVSIKSRIFAPSFCEDNL